MADEAPRRAPAGYNDATMSENDPPPVSPGDPRPPHHPDRVEDFYRPPKSAQIDPRQGGPLDKQSYTIRVVVAAVLMVVVQFLIPMIGMVIMMPMLFSSMFNRDIETTEDLVQLEGDLIFVKRTKRMMRPEEGWTSSLQRLDLSSAEAEPVKIADLHMAEPRLLALGDKIWIFSEGTMAVYEDGAARVVPSRADMTSTTPPFVYQGEPAVIDETYEGRILKVYSSGNWQTRARLHIPYEEGAVNLPDIVLNAGEDLYSFYSFGGKVYYTKGLPGLAPHGDFSWQVAADAPMAWTAIVIKGTPAIFVDAQQGSKRALKGYRLVNGSWELFFEHQVSFVTNVKAAARDDGGFILGTQGFGGVTRFLDVSPQGEVLSERQVGEPFNPFGQMRFMTWSIAINGLTILSVIPFVLYFTSLMRRYKEKRLVWGEKSVRYASLTRRAIAKAIDGVIMWTPAMIGGFMMMRLYEDMERFITQSNTAFYMTLIFGGYGWAFLWWFVFSITEGIWGLTPGKRLVRIRVLRQNLERCGIGWSLLRNLILYVDFFMMGAVGAVFIALTQKWQRLGDLAAKTVVVSDT